MNSGNGNNMDMAMAGSNDNLSTSDNYSEYNEESKSGYYFYEDIEKLSVPTTWMYEPHVVPLIVIYGAVFLCGLVGNGIVIFSILGSRSSRGVTFTFMVSLAIADVLFLTVVIPHETLRMILGGWPGGRIFCKISGFTEMLTAVASILNLTAVSFERYFVIVMPMKSRRKCTVGYTRRLLTIVWTLSLFLSAPTLYVRDTQETTYYNNESSVTIVFCSDHGLKDYQRIHFAVYQFLIMFVIPTGLMLFCYAAVIYVLWISGRTLITLTSNNHSCRHRSSFRNTSDGSPQNTSSDSRSCKQFVGRHQPSLTVVRDSILNGRKQVIKMLITVIVIFLVCWGPKLIFRLIKYSDFGVYTEAHFNLQIALQCLPYVQSCLNPLIYGFMSKNFRRSVVTSCNKYVIKSNCRGQRSPVAELEMEMKFSNGTFHVKR